MFLLPFVFSHFPPLRISLLLLFPILPHDHFVHLLRDRRETPVVCSCIRKVIYSPPPAPRPAFLAGLLVLFISFVVNPFLSQS